MLVAADNTLTQQYFVQLGLERSEESYFKNRGTTDLVWQEQSKDSRKISLLMLLSARKTSDVRMRNFPQEKMPFLSCSVRITLTETLFPLFFPSRFPLTDEKYFAKPSPLVHMHMWKVASKI